MSKVNNKVTATNSQLAQGLTPDISRNNASSAHDRLLDKGSPLLFSYRQFSQAKQVIRGIEAIDYFFAKEVSSSLLGDSEYDHKFDMLERDNLFHLCLALSTSFRDGHTCLPLTHVGDKLWGESYVANSNENSQASLTQAAAELQVIPTDVIDQPKAQGGFSFASLEFLKTLLTKLSIKAEHQQLIVLQQEQLYIRRYFIFEQNLAKSIRIRLGAHNPYPQEQISNCLDSLFPADSALNINGNETLDIDWQKIAVANAINKNFSVIAGGPGTGKTYTVTKLLAALLMLEQQRRMQQVVNQQTSIQQTEIQQTDIEGNHKSQTLLKIALVAPTGKAAQRLSESIVNAVSGFKGLVDESVLTNIPTTAETIHRLLGVIPNSPNFKHNKNNQLVFDIVLIDEVSMVDLPLMTRLINAIKPTTKLILLGDADQLPSVAAGSILADIAPRPHHGFSENNLNYLSAVCKLNKEQLVNALSSSVPSQGQHLDYLTFLMKSRRFDGQGGIGLLASAVIQGNVKMSWHFLEQAQKSADNRQSHELTLAQGSLNEWLLPLVNHYYRPIARAADIQSAFTLLSQFRVLCVTRQGDYGVEAINEVIESYLGNHNTRVQQQQSRLYHGQPIMITENDYRLGLYNGDIGIIWQFEDADGNSHLMAHFENNNGTEQSNKMKTFIPSRLPNFETVYAMTIHKTQGSEFSHVAIAIAASQQDSGMAGKGSKLLSRELLYTGITRAKSLLTIAVNKSVWQQGVTSQVKRYSGLNLSEPS
jgi:exodeoxyribonuclease V alpha subunit